MSYQKGRNFENYIKDKLERKGYFVVRSAASKGVYDLIAIKNGVVYGIQCKAGKARASKQEKERMVEFGEKYGIVPVLATKRSKRVVFVDVRSNIDLDL